MEDLRQSARAIEQGEAGYDVYQRALSSGPTSVSGDQSFVLLSSLKRAYSNRFDDLAPNQRQVIEAVIQDLDRSMKVNAPSIRMAGSDTMQNMSIASLLGRVAGGGVVDTMVGDAISRVMAPVSRLAAAGQTPIQDLMVEVMMDPKAAAALMRKATPGNIKYAQSIVNQIVQGSRRGAEAAAIQSQSGPAELTVAPTTPQELQRLEGLLGR
jgi:hypothetical protein